MLLYRVWHSTNGPHLPLESPRPFFLLIQGAAHGDVFVPPNRASVLTKVGLAPDQAGAARLALALEPNHELLIGAVAGQLKGGNFYADTGGAGGGVQRFVEVPERHYIAETRACGLRFSSWRLGTVLFCGSETDAGRPKWGKHLFALAGRRVKKLHRMLLIKSMRDIK